MFRLDISEIYSLVPCYRVQCIHPHLLDHIPIGCSLPPNQRFWFSSLGEGLRIFIFQSSQVLLLFSHNEKHCGQLKESKLKESTNPPLQMATVSQSNSFQTFSAKFLREAFYKHCIHLLTSQPSPDPFNLLSIQAHFRSCQIRLSAPTLHPLLSLSADLAYSRHLWTTLRSGC